MSASSVTVDSKTAASAPAGVPRQFIKRLLRRGLTVACVAYLLVVVGVAIAAPLVMPDIAGQHAGDLASARQGPSWNHLLGTDSLGRDILDRLLVGVRVTIIGVAEALAVVLALGVPLGLVAGFYGGWVDRIVSWLADLTFSMPAILIILVVLSVFPQSMTAAMVTLGVIAAPALMRIVRSATLPVRQELYIAAAQVAGLSRPYILVRHVLPRIAGAVIVQASLLAAAALLVQSGLAFLNLIVPAPAPSWGGMVADGVAEIVRQPWLIWPPGIAIAVTILALGLLGDSVRDATTENWAAPAYRPRRHVRGRHTAPREFAAEVPDSDVLLSIEGLRVDFPSQAGRTTVVDDVSFSIRAGETVGVVGESGCGKTATAMSILGLLPGAGRIGEGRVLFEGRDLVALGEHELRRVRGKAIGLISQEPMISLNPVFRVGWQLAEAVRRHHGVTRQAAKARANELLRLVHLPDPEAVAARYPHELSGGMAQRVSIARALAGDPKLLIADEPTTALDVTVQAEILDLLREIQREHGMAILLVTHDWGVVADLCDRAVVMYAGEVVERAEIRPLFQQPLHPYTKALLASNPHNAPESIALAAIPGSVPNPGNWPTGCHFHPRCSFASDACRQQPIRLVKPTPERETRCIHYDQLALTSGRTPSND